MRDNEEECRFHNEEQAEKARLTSADYGEQGSRSAGRAKPAFRPHQIGASVVLDVTIS